MIKFNRRQFILSLLSLSIAKLNIKSVAAEQIINYKEYDISNYDTALVPRGHGQLISTNKYYIARYPSRDQSMQLMAFFNKVSGLYIQTKDPIGYITDWEILPYGKLRIHFYGNEPEIIVQNISSNYKEAVTLYKDWALKQSWAKKKQSNIDNVGIIAVGSSNNLDLMKTGISSFLSNFQSPNGNWITQWRKDAFDVNYPDYTPKDKVKFSMLLSAMDSNNIIPFPYINGLLWDQNCTSPKYDLAQMVLDKDGKAPSYNKKLDHLRVACPSTNIWKEIIINARNNLLSTEKRMSRGVYYDVLAATTPRFCYAENHNHAPGDPGSWQKSIREILSSTEGIIITEGNAEVYIDLVDAFMMHAYTDQKNTVPLWHEVYGGVSNSVGWIIDKNLNAEETLAAMEKAKGYGVLGWGSPWMTARIQENLVKPEYGAVINKIKSKYY